MAKNRQVSLGYLRLFFAALVLTNFSASSAAGSLNFDKMRNKGAQYSRELRYFLDSGFVPGRQSAIEMQLEGFERSIAGYKEAKHTEKNPALKAVQASYERFQIEFRDIADVLRALIDKYKKTYYERSSEAITNTTTKEKVLRTIEVGKQDEARALAAYNNRNFSYSAQVYLRSLKHFMRAFELRGWQQLVQSSKPPVPKSPKK